MPLDCLANILCKTFAISPGWFAGYNLITNASPRGLPTRFDKIFEEAKFVAPRVFDGKLAADSPAKANKVQAGCSRPKVMLGPT